jgi:dephospho-CoA kinase
MMASRPRALRIGLTGPIGCGKSTIAGWLADGGATVVDADEIARAVTAPGEPALDAIFAVFGDAVRATDGSLDRAALGRIVFADPDRLSVLEAIVHPAVRPRLLAAVEAAEGAGAGLVVIEAIRLVESGLAELCDETWLVVCDAADQRVRLRLRAGGTAARGRGTADADADADQRIAAQEGIVDRLRPFATRIVDSSGDWQAARSSVEAALEAALWAWQAG